ncbi:MAG: ion transporter [Candidatus Cloacimonetes bacterium]|jgi:voltage-gated potassium channel|nr:ion transporter [Candidatus Cloacimonadota bacterium]
MSLEFVLPFSPELIRVTTSIDYVVCFLFIGEYVYKAATASRPLSYAGVHVFDLISSIPAIPSLRFFRLMRVFRFMRGFRGITSLIKAFQKKPMGTALVTYTIYTGVILFYSSLAFNKYEFLLNEKVNGYGDSLWMAFTTLTTIGYGDIYPVSTEGRFVAVVLVLTGAGFFALLSGEMATLLIGTSKQDKH